MPAMPSKPADPDALPDAPADHAGAEFIDHPSDLVPGNARKGEARPLAFDRETVAVAHAAGLDPNSDLAVVRFGDVTFEEFKRAAGPRNLHCPHLRDRRLLLQVGA